MIEGIDFEATMKYMEERAKRGEMPADLSRCPQCGGKTEREPYQPDPSLPKVNVILCRKCKIVTAFEPLSISEALKWAKKLFRSER